MYQNQMIESAAEMFRLGYSEEQVIRLLRIPMHLAEDIVEAADNWNFHYDQMCVSPEVVSTEDIL